MTFSYFISGFIVIAFLVILTRIIIQGIIDLYKNIMK
jgi:hypothetical protein